MKNTTKRVCIIRHGYFPQDPRVRKEVSALREADIDVTVICLQDRGEPAVEQWQAASIFRQPVQHIRGSILRYLYEYWKFFFHAFIKTASLHAKEPFQVVQINTMPDFLVFSALVPKLLGARVVLDMHELMPEFFRAKFKFRFSGIFIAIITLVERLSMSFADVVILPSNVRKNLIIQRGGDPGKIVLVYNTPEENLFQKNFTMSAAPGEGFDLIAHGTIIEMYGYQVLLKSLPIVKTEFPRISVAIVGGGEYLTTLKAMARELDVESNVVFTGRLPIEEMAGYIQRAKIGVMPIIKDEFTQFAAPNKLFEYIAMDKPVICTDIIGIREYVGSDDVLFFESGNEVDLASKITSLMNDAGMQHRLVESAWGTYGEIRWNKNKIVYRDTIAAGIRRAATS